LFSKSLLALAPHGRQVCISVPPGQPSATFDLFDFYRRELRLFGLNTLTTLHVDAHEILKAIAAGFDSGALTAPQVKPYSLSDAHKAYEAVANGEKGGKAVIQPWN
jgi:NADPH:quinone reductase